MDMASKRAWILTRWFLAMSLVAMPLAAQDIISVVGGMVYHVEGDIFIEDKAIKFDPGRRPQLEKGEKLRTENGRTEVMVVHDGFMRLAPHSSMEMVRAGSDSAQMRLHNGTAIVDLAEVWDSDSVSAFIGDNQIKFLKGGLYRLEARENEPARIKVFKGKAAVMVDDKEIAVKSKRVFELGGESSAAVKFDHKDIDGFDEWQRVRAGIIVEKRKTAIAAARKGEGERADQILFKQGSAMWGCRQVGIGCRGALGGGIGGGRQGGIGGPGVGGGGGARPPSGGAGGAPGGGGGGRGARLVEDRGRVALRIPPVSIQPRSGSTQAAMVGMSKVSVVGLRVGFGSRGQRSILRWSRARQL